MARTPPQKKTIDAPTHNNNIHDKGNTINDLESSIHQSSHPFCKNYDISCKMLLEIKSIDIFLAAKDRFININSCINCIDLYYSWREKVFSASVKFNEDHKESIQDIKLNRLQTRKNYKSFFLKLDIYRILLGTNKFLLYEISKYNWRLLKNNCMRKQFLNELNELSDMEIYNIFNNEEKNFPVELLYLSKSIRINGIAERIINQRLFKNSIVYKTYLNIHNFCIECDSSEEHKSHCVLYNTNNKQIQAESNSISSFKNTIELYKYLMAYWQIPDHLKKSSSRGEDIIDYQNITTLEILTILINTITLHDYISDDIINIFNEFQKYKELEKSLVYLIFISVLSKLNNKTFINHEILLKKIKETKNIKEKIDFSETIKAIMQEYNMIISEGIICMNQGLKLNYIPKIINVVEFLTNYDLLVPYLNNIYNPSFKDMLLFDLIQIFAFSTYFPQEKDIMYSTYLSEDKEMINIFLKSLVKEKVQLNNHLKEKIIFNTLQGRIFHAIAKSGIYAMLINILFNTSKKQCNSCELLFPEIYNIMYDLIRSNKTILNNGLTIPVIDIKTINTIINIQSNKLIEKLIFMFDKYFQSFIRRRNTKILFLIIKGLYEIVNKATEMNTTQIIDFLTFFKFDYTTFISLIQISNKNKISILYENTNTYIFDNEDHLKSQILEIYKQTKLLFNELIRNYYIEPNSSNIEMFEKFENIILTQSFFMKDKIEIHRRPYLYINFVINELKHVCFTNALYNNLLRRIYKTHSMRMQPENFQTIDIKPILSLNNIFVDSHKVINKAKIPTVNNEDDSIHQYLIDINSHMNFLTNNLLVNQEKYFLLKLKILEIQNSKNLYSLKYSERANGVLLYETINFFNYLIAEINNYILFHKQIPELLIIILSIIAKSDQVEFSVYVNILSILVIMEDSNIENVLIQTFLRVENIENIFNYEIFFTILKKTSNSSEFIDEMFYQICLLVSLKKLKNNSLYNILLQELDRIHMKSVYKKIERNSIKKGLVKGSFLKYTIQELSKTSNLEKYRYLNVSNVKNDIKISHSLKFNQKDITTFVKLFSKNKTKSESPMKKLNNKQVISEFHETNEKYLKKYVVENQSADSSSLSESGYHSNSSSSVLNKNVSNEEIKSLVQVKLESSDTEHAGIIKVKRVLDVFWESNGSSEISDMKEPGDDKQNGVDIFDSEDKIDETTVEGFTSKQKGITEKELVVVNSKEEIEHIEINNRQKEDQNDYKNIHIEPSFSETRQEAFNEPHINSPIKEVNEQVSIYSSTENQRDFTVELSNFSTPEGSDELSLARKKTSYELQCPKEPVDEYKNTELVDEYKSNKTLQILTNNLMKQTKAVISNTESNHKIDTYIEDSQTTKDRITKEGKNDDCENTDKPLLNTYPMSYNPSKRLKLSENYEKATETTENFKKIINEMKVIPKRESQIIDITEKLNEKRKSLTNEVFNPHQIMQKFDVHYFFNYILNISIDKPVSVLKSINLLRDFENFEDFFETYKIFIYSETVYSIISNLMEYNSILDWRYLNSDNSTGEFLKYKFITTETDFIQLNSIVLFTNEDLANNKNRIQYLKKPNIDEDILDFNELFNIDSESKYNIFNTDKQVETGDRDYIFGYIQYCTTLNGKTIITIQTNKALQFKQNITKILLIMNTSSTLKELKCLYHLSSNRILNLLMKPSLLKSSMNNIKSKYLDKVEDSQIYNTLAKIKEEFQLNDSQKMAIANCLSNDVFTLIQGPPGTGKSSTIIALSYLLINMGLRIMISAASNTAVDHITRLIHNNDKFKDIKTTRLGILNSVSEDIQPLMPGYLTNPERIKNKLTDKILTNQYLKSKTKSLYETSQIFTSTLNSSYSRELVNKIDVLIVDEVCQAVDTSLFVSLNLNPQKIILIGDPNQLPPTIISGNKSYETTIFSRLSQFQPVNLLNIQYRMNPDIARFPSEYFYENNLENGISDEIYQEVLKTVSIPYFPCSFINVNGKEVHSINSFYNQTEIDVSLHLITKIYSNYKNNDRTIGLITPYSAQVKKLRERVNSLSINIRNNIQISTVDGFQGQEKDFIIFSTVRTEKIGFLKDERRINVAFTRAKYGLCVLGNKNALQSEVWLKFYEYAKGKGKLFKS